MVEEEDIEVIEANAAVTKFEGDWDEVQDWD